MKFFRLWLLGLFGLLMSCEEVIELDLNDVPSKVVIEADINDLRRRQSVYVSKTARFSDSRASDPVADAQVYLLVGNGGYYHFAPTQMPGQYQARILDLKPNVEYMLHVEVNGEVYRATDVMPEYIEVDSLGAGRERFFDEYVYYGSLQFRDPPEEANFYKYDIAVNDDAFQFGAVWSDRFNDGLSVTHQINSPQRNMSISDTLRIRRFVVSAPVYRYWSEIQAANPGVAAPANPRSNISNGALGYFSVSSGREYNFSISDIEMARLGEEDRKIRF